MSTDADTQDLQARIRELRSSTVRELRRVFEELEDMADSESMGGLVTLAARYERERDAARARISELESELRSRPPLGTKPSNSAILLDAAMTLRNAVSGIANAPLSHPASAAVIGQANKAVVAFDDQVKDILP